jgi:putative ABC transport system ATP-binding protein
LATHNQEPLVQLEHVVKTYETGAGTFTALKGITADFYRGEFITVIGKSGAGKSTLVNMITGVDTLTEGKIWVQGTSIYHLSENERALWRGKTLGVIYQSFELLPQLSLIDNVLMPIDMCGLYRPQESYARAVDLLTRVGLKDHMHKIPSRISGGQKQRVAIARALANDPDLIVADEPTGSLDSATAEGIFTLFQELVDQGKTIVMVTHDQSLSQRSTRTLQLVEGKLNDRADRTKRSPISNGIRGEMKSL